MADRNIVDTLHDKAVALRDTLIDQQLDLQQYKISAAFGRILGRARVILLENLESAIQETDEYNTDSLKIPLLGLFSHPDLLYITADGFVQHLADEIVGDANDFQDGITAARASLGLDKSSSSPEQKARFWRDRIYAPYRLGIAPTSGGKKKKKRKLSSGDYAKMAYERTIEARKSGWSGKAPYWLILEEGNAGSNYAFPHFGGTYFLRNSILAIQRLFNSTLSQLDSEIDDIINNEIIDFINDPDSYAPGTIFDQIIVEGKIYYIYVTPTKRLGTAQRPTL